MSAANCDLSADVRRFGPRKTRLTCRCKSRRGRCPMMNDLPLLIVIWAVFTGLFLALLAYNATITRYEDNQVFLDDKHRQRRATAVYDRPENQQDVALHSCARHPVCHLHGPHHRHLHMGLLAEAPGPVNAGQLATPQHPQSKQARTRNAEEPASNCEAGSMVFKLQSYAL